MLTREDILAFLTEKKEEFFSQYNLTKLGVFGSFARGEASSVSDIDLIIEFKPNTANLSDKKSALKDTIGSHFNREVDLCREKYIKPYFKKQILQSAIYV
ncbi:MAG: nucleotidyltransferase domain-containing protein [Bacteroidota bacterium]